MSNIKTDYQVFRGKCKEVCEHLQAVLPDLRLAKGWYNEPGWDKNSCHHWWLVSPEGTIVDPTAGQFPSKGISQLYEEFDEETTLLNCYECGKEITYDQAKKNSQGRYVLCSGECYGRLVGVY